MVSVYGNNLNFKGETEVLGGDLSIGLARTTSQLQHIGFYSLCHMQLLRFHFNIVSITVLALKPDLLFKFINIYVQFELTTYNINYLS